MRNEKRKSPRKPLRYTAWIAGRGFPRIACMVVDISDSGARLDVKNAEILPQRFSLILAGRGLAQRECKVVWRKPHQVGVHFENREATQRTDLPAPSIVSA